MTPTSRSRWALGALLLVGCAPPLDGHRCAGAPGSCGAGGVCEPTGVCSFADRACPSGRAYGDAAAGGLAGQCTPDPCGDRTLAWRDDFDEPGAAPRFSDDPATTGADREVDGQLEIAVGASAGDGGSYDTAAPLDLRGGAVILEVASVPMVASYFSYLEIQGGAHRAAIWQTSSGTPRVVASLDGGDLTQRPWDGTERFWRLSEGGGTLSWEVSTDGVAWATFHSAATPFDVSQVVASPQTWSEGPGGAARFEAFTVCAP